jgi:glycosyltransferase involved in cell wall biosynthesis
MINIAFYLPNKQISNVDCSTIEAGNPGIGGSPYAMIALVYYLSKLNHSRYNIKLYAESIENLPLCINRSKVVDLVDLSAELANDKIDIFVINKGGKDSANNFFFETIKKLNIKVILWAHCFIPNVDLKYYSKVDMIKRIVCVSKEQLHTYRDHDAFNKSSYIYNLCDLKDESVIEYSSRANIVVFIGSLVPLKGFHLIADIWRKVVAKVPDAQLFVVGGGNLYDRNAKLGKYKIADFFYEKRILKKIKNKDGSILDSVHFCGVMGAEKYDLLKKAKVGVPNPSGKTETFGYTAIEMQLSGMMITTKKCPGYIETVCPDSGLLYSSEKRLADNIVYLLGNRNYEANRSKEYIYDKFSDSLIISKWKTLFDEVYSDEKVSFIASDSQIGLSRVKEYNRKLRQFIPFLPSVLFFEELYNYLSYISIKLIELPTTLHKVYIRKIK